MSDRFEIVTIADRRDLLEQIDNITSSSWPEFMLHDPIANENWPKLYRHFPEFQFALVDVQSDQVMAVGNSVPLDWDGDIRDLPDEGWDWAMTKAFEGLSSGVTVRIQCAISITVSAGHLGTGLSHRMVEAMKKIGQDHGLRSMIAPVRPNMKSRYPLIPMERYVQWRRKDGLPIDPWIRVHERLGAEIVKVCPRSMRIPASISDWEHWTEMQFPGDGEYVVPGALVPISIDHASDQGLYIEPNVWMHHA